MDRARFRAEFETLCHSTEELLREAASGGRMDRQLVEAYRRADLDRRRYRHLFMTTAEAEVLTERNRRRAAEAGFAHYLLEPLDVAAVDVLLRRRAAG